MFLIYRSQDCNNKTNTIFLSTHRHNRQLGDHHEQFAEFDKILN